jgi:hypothetical protein
LLAVVYTEGVRRTPEFFGDRELSLIFIAKRLPEALHLENLLTSAGIDYLIETDTYHGGVVFPSARVGAFFYVLPADECAARQLIAAHGFRPYQPLGAP